MMFINKSTTNYHKKIQQKDNIFKKTIVTKKLINDKIAQKNSCV